MAIKKQLKDKDGNTIYPDVGLDLDSVVYSDDPTTPTSTDPWIEGDDVVWSTMKRWVPDYSNATSLSLNSSGGVTLTETGWVTYHYYGYSTNKTHEIWIKVNNTKVFDQIQEATAPNTARALQGDVMFPVSTGDVITQSGALAGRSAIFIPGKWV